MATYSEKTHIDRTVYRARISNWIYFLPSVFIVLGVIMCATNDLVALGGIFIFIGLLVLIKRFIYVHTTELYITEKFTIAKYGLIRRETIEMLNSKVESLRINQGVIGRILNYGDIIIVGAGGSSSPIRFIDTPLEFRRQLIYMQEGNGGK